MRIDFIHPAHYRDDGSLVQARPLIDRLDPYLPHLGPLIMAAVTPDHHEVRFVEEYFTAADLDSDADVIALSAQIMQIDRAMDLSREYRARGKKVILGGFLPTMLPDRCRGAFDAIVVGEAEEVWPTVLRDIELGRLQPEYRPTRPVDLTALPPPRYDLLPRWRLTLPPIQATRGCPFRCGYCSIAAFWRGSYRKRPVEHVLRDIEASGRRYVNFCDDNLCEDVKYAGRLFDAMAGADVRWGTQTTINVAKHPWLLEKARRAGCTMMAIGVETLNMTNLEAVEKHFNVVDDYAAAFERIMSHGISPLALIIFGLPHDRPDVFERTVSYLERLKLPAAQFFLMTPYPNTPSGDAVWKEGRVVDERLAHFREPYVVFRHEHLSADALREGWWKTIRRFYSLPSILRRIVRRGAPNLWQDLGQNLVARWKVGRGVHPVYFNA
jgi:radical SAM superfamily enzyme YgiQ (UPF0313 family)